jgi:hypothetical protein
MRGPQNKSRRTKRMQRDATAVSIVLVGRRFGNFAKRQQLAHGAPLMRMPLCGRRDEETGTETRDMHETDEVGT